MGSGVRFFGAFQRILHVELLAAVKHPQKIQSGDEHLERFHLPLSQPVRSRRGQVFKCPGTNEFQVARNDVVFFSNGRSVVSDRRRTCFARFVRAKSPAAIAARKPVRALDASRSTRPASRAVVRRRLLADAAWPVAYRRAAWPIGVRPVRRPAARERTSAATSREPQIIPVAETHSAISRRRARLR